MIPFKQIIRGIVGFMFLVVLPGISLRGNDIKNLGFYEEKLLYLELEEQDNLRSQNQEDDFSGKFILISLGQNCEAAYNINRVGLGGAFFPLNWLRSHDFDLVIELIKTKFKNFLKKDALQITGICGEHHIVSNKDYALEFMHDFDKEKTLEGGYDEVKTKYDRRIVRFCRALQTNKQIYFFRRNITKKQANGFCLMMKKNFPKTKYTLIAVDERIECRKPWNIKNVTNFYYTPEKPHGSVWEHTHKMWDYIFKYLKLFDKQPVYAHLS